MSRRIDLQGVAGAITAFRRSDRGAWIIRVGLIGGALIIASVHRPPVPKFIWNASASAPIGLYRVEKSTIERGDLVLVWMPDDIRRLAAERHYLPASVPLVKRVAAMPGDTVCTVGQQIFINGRVVAKRLDADGQGRPLPYWNGCYLLGPDELFLLMENARDSFDGRYFGPIATSRIIGRLVPLWTH